MWSAVREIGLSMLTHLMLRPWMEDRAKMPKQEVVSVQSL